MSKNKKANKVAPKGAKRKNKMANSKAETIAVSNKSGPRVPRAVQSGNGTVVTHTETYGVNVTGSDPFSVFATWALQPGLKTYSRGSPLGQWLPEIAQNFDTYEIEQLRFKFRTACSTLTTGLAVFGFEPNPEGTSPTTYQELRNMYSADVSVHSNLTFDVSSRCRKKLLIRKGGVVNLPSYDAGKVYFATIGVTGNALIGFVDVEYRIRLSNPQASITSSTLVPVNPQLPLPTQRYVLDASVMPSVDCSASSDEAFSRFIGSAVTTGAVSLTKVAARNYLATNVNLDNGCKFVHGARTLYNQLIFNYSGRFRVRFNPKWDWKDLNMFAIVPFGGGPGVAMSRYNYQVYNNIDGSGMADLPCQIYTHRGFTGVATLDPDPGTDVWPSMEWDVNVVASDGMIIMIGFLDYNGKSTAATVTGRAGLGNTELLITYLGPTVVM